MYNAFFGLDVDPFRVNPDPRFLYFSESHREALATLIYSVQQRKGFIVLTGEVGTGKTTILNALLGKLDADVQTAFIFNTALTVRDFLSYLLDELELDVPAEPFQKSAALHGLNHYLIERLKHGKQTLLIVDEAQNLSAELLEEIRMLSNLETPQSKLIQILLVGQPELADKLASPELRQLRQRVELRHEICALDARETSEYVRERLLIAGHETGELFTSAALRALYRRTAGIPRVTNVLCDNALLTAFSRRSLRVSSQMVNESAEELGLDELPVRRTIKSEPVARQDGWVRRWWGRRAPEPA